MSHYPGVGVLTVHDENSFSPALNHYLPESFRLHGLTEQTLSALQSREANAAASRERLLLWPVSGMILADDKISVASFPADLPVITESSLTSAPARQQFIQAVSARAEFDRLCATDLTASQLIRFHSCYKLLFLAHSQPRYRELGPMVAGMSEYASVAEFALAYRQKFMALLSYPATRENHTNVLMHIQGYFRPHLDAPQRQQLTVTIDEYRRGLLPLSAPVAALQHCLAAYPHSWLAGQRYLFPYLSIPVPEIV